MVLTKIPKHIEIVRSSTVALSSMSQKSCDAIYNLLKRHYTEVGVTTVNSAVDLELLVARQPDLVFIGMKYVPGILPNSKVWISEYLERHHIKHTGSYKDAIELEQNKPFAKQRVQDAGIKTAPYVVLKNGEPFDYKNIRLQFPLFVKPVDRGGGVGIDNNSVVHTVSELAAKAKSIATAYATDALVEEYLPGREFSVAVLKHEYSDELMVMPLELVAGTNVHGDRILSHQLKSAALETPVFPVIDTKIKDRLIDLATSVFTALGARDYGRIDIRLDATGVPHFLEANLIPCLIRGSGNFPKACMMNIGMDYQHMILHIVRLGLAHPIAFTEQTQETSSFIYSPADASVAI